MHGETAGEETTHPPSPPARSDGPAAGKTGGVARAPREAERSEREGDDIVSNGREKGEEEKGSGRGATVEKGGGNEFCSIRLCVSVVGPTVGPRTEFRSTQHFSWTTPHHHAHALPPRTTTRSAHTRASAHSARHHHNHHNHHITPRFVRRTHTETKCRSRATGKKNFRCATLEIGVNGGDGQSSTRFRCAPTTRTTASGQ